MKAKMMKTKMTNLRGKSQQGVYTNAPVLVAMGFAGIFAGVVFLYLIFSHFDKGSVEVDVSQPSQASVVQSGIQAKLPVKKTSMVAPKGSEISGRWFTRFGENAVAEIVFGDNDSFEIIFTQDPQGAVRKYSRGSFAYDESTGLLSLTPSAEAGEPQAIQGVSYKVLTMRPFDIFLLKESGAPDLHFIAPEEDILVKAVHPLFLFADYAGAPVLRFLPAQ